ncbi:MAG: cystathionine beta-lyase [Deltaproteobacteria bacterium RBG_13_49_15]|nr:MAG: cystathionine beta-lyase [Deltaproteobacteria bacterium RBG_13_49_15]
MKKETQCVHSGTVRDETTRGINSPIYTSSAFEYLDRDEVLYPRYFNTPNQEAVVRKICALEGAEDGVLFSSGMAAISTSILAFAGAGDHVIMLDDLYGGSHAFATNEFQRLGIEYSFTRTDDLSVREALKKNTTVVVIESPTNPLLNIIDIRKVALFARNHNLITIIDNTFASPVNQTPFRLGIDIVIHSGTKYLGGHSDICCGIAVSAKEKASRIRSLAKHLGGSLNAMTCYLLERSLKTLAIRVQRQTENAGQIARYLNAHPSVRKVNYPGLDRFDGHQIAKNQMEGFGAMLSFEPDESKISATRIIKRLQLIKPAVSLGGVDTTICSPAVTSHSKISAEERQRVGISDALLRLSVGIEQIDDLISDFRQALE